jgi:hypothetical protein
MKTSHILCLCLLAASSLSGKEQRPFRVPTPSLEEAVALVKKHHEEHPGTLKGIFIDEAVFVREPQKAYWKIGVRHTEYETGHLIYKVSTDGVVAIDSVIKDG